MSGWYGPARQRIINGTTQWDNTATHKAVVIDAADYTYARTHASLTDVPAGARQGTPVTLAGKTVNAAGEIDCNDFTITGLAAGQDTAEAVLIYEDGASDAARFPLLYIDGLTIIPNGGDYVFQISGTSPFLGRF